MARISEIASVDLPPVPAVPSIWNPQNILIFVAAAATFVVGLLAEVGQILPAGTTTEVAVISGVVAQIGALAASLGTVFSHNSTVAKVTAAQASIHVAALNRTA